MIKKVFSDVLLVIRKAGNNFMKNDPITLAGALAFFTIFAFPPILIIIKFGVGLITGEEIANREIFQIINSSVGEQGAELIRNIVENYFVKGQGFFQRALTIGIFVFASSTYFIIIQHSLNRIWQVKPKSEKNFLKILKNRVVSFALILVMGITLLMSLVLDSVLVILRNNLDNFMPGFAPAILNTLGFLLSFLLVMLILGIIYKFLPDVIIEWKVVWVGAAVTSFLFTLGKLVIRFGLLGSNVQEMYGTAGSTAIFLLWVFYSSIILFFGAEITQQYALSFAETIQPKEHAVKIVTHEADTDYVAKEHDDNAKST